TLDEAGPRSALLEKNDFVDQRFELDVSDPGDTNRSDVRFRVSLPKKMEKREGQNLIANPVGSPDEDRTWIARSAPRISFHSSFRPAFLRAPPRSGERRRIPLLLSLRGGQ